MRTREIIRNAKRYGKRAGESAAGWAFQPGRERNAGDMARRILAGIEDGDPAIMDAFYPPNLSGEYAGDPTPQSHEASSDSFWTSLSRSCRAIL